MGIAARIRHTPGGAVGIPTIASSSTIEIPSDVNVCYISGSSSVSVIYSGPVHPGRQLTLIGDTGGRDIVNGSSLAVRGSLHLGSASEITLGANDVLRLVQVSTGAWLRVFSTDN